MCKVFRGDSSPGFVFPSPWLQEILMRNKVVLLVALVGVAAGFLVVFDGASAACPPPVYYSPPPVYYCPPPVYYTPPVCSGRPIYYAAPPVYYCPPPVVYYYPPVYVPTVPQPPKQRTLTVKGKTYLILPTGEKGEDDENEELLPNRLAVAKTANIPEKDHFSGTYRKIAKVTIFKGEPKAFNSVSELRDSLPTDQVMKGLNIGRGVGVDRVEQEQQNVTVKAYIYAFRKEGDNDYHVIIGDAPDTPGRKYLNVEVSGIPEIGTDDNRNQLWTVRRAFKQTFELGDDGPDSYDRLQEPMPVQITGSLFWDGEHWPRTVGPSYAAPKTAWEIHPISKIEFLD
jgi:hypothetical protein